MRTMQSGRQTLSSIDQGVRLIHDQVQNIDEQIKEAAGNLVELKKEQADRYKRMAKIRLDNVISGELAAGLDAAGQRVSELLQQREQELASLREQIKANQEEQVELSSKREKCSEQTSQATEALDKAEAETQQRLEQDPAYQIQLKKTREAESTAEHADDKTKQAEDVRKQKGQPYEADSLFSYLWKRGYGTSSYSANALTRFLDKWVARLCDYHDARSDYAMLLEIPKRLHEHAQRVRVVADKEFAALTHMEEQAAKEDGVPALSEALEKVQTELDEIDSVIEQAERQLHQLEQKRTSFVGGEDEQFRRAVDTLSSVFARESLLSLYEYARATVTAEDDLLVRELEQGNNLSQQTREELAEHKRVRERHFDRLQELEGVRTRFKQQRYDSTHSGFGNAALVAMILNQFLQGTVTSGELWRTIEREQRYRRVESNPDFGSGGFKRRRGTWHFPFPRGGGGLGRGGGFGGGGGFRTGGGF